MDNEELTQKELFDLVNATVDDHCVIEVALNMNREGENNANTKEL